MRLVHWVLLLLCVGVFGSADARADDPIDFLAQAVCLDADGSILPVPPTSAQCTRRRPQSLDDEAVYRKFDQPDVWEAAAKPFGYQASDSVTAGVDSVVVQSFDFGDAPRRFGSLDSGEGDGGQAIVILNGAAYAFFTEDGGAGSQWFVGPGCRSDGNDNRRFQSWLLFEGIPEPGQWRESMAELRRVRSPDSCPHVFSRSLTRYGRSFLAFPLRFIARGSPPREETTLLDVIISDHYGRGSIALSDHLERFYFAKYLGLVQWERWEQLGLSLVRDAHARAAHLARTRRCDGPPVQTGLPPAWVMVDCRRWTTIAPPTNRQWSVSDYGWPPAAVLAPLGGAR